MTSHWTCPYQRSALYTHLPPQLSKRPQAPLLVSTECALHRDRWLHGLFGSWIGSWCIDAWILTLCMCLSDLCSPSSLHPAAGSEPAWEAVGGPEEGRYSQQRGSSDSPHEMTGSRQKAVAHCINNFSFDHSSLLLDTPKHSQLKALRLRGFTTFSPLPPSFFFFFFPNGIPDLYRASGVSNKEASSDLDIAG